ncbi:tRNA lysidine(34) synthetase TilS [Nicoliella spurrieriana]|uniref:tRNA(Ile)-lysidine synthase n=1 Tax=Nicoliella spurrieriana TaxID=2925830 RepID=A0A976X5T6_9LACO|nr:tRNA lysidine(34) synthetase TilS [Nicoliella spurrieriana]UQS87044.1 tRNA lysidine(34) synthetase TilS [Nicoliella spurrieriana]
MDLELRKRFASNVFHHQWWQSDQPVVVAVSTGVDSMVLLDLLQHLRNERPRIIVAHVNHELRNASNTEQQFITNYCHARNIELVIGRWPLADHPQSGIEEAARKFRYAFFERVMKQFNAKWLLTAHHQNDQAETVLMKLMRGDNLTQIRGIQPNRPFGNGQLVRPLLPFDKQTVLDYAREDGVKWYEDSTNHNDDVTRNRIRHHLLPMMERENPRIVPALSRFADQLSATVAVNQFLVKRVVTKLKLQTEYQLAPFLQMPLELQVQCMAIISSELGERPLSEKHLQMMVTILNNQQKPQGDYKINSRIILHKNYDCFKLEFNKNVKKNTIKIQQIMVRLNHWYQVNDRMSVGVFAPSQTTNYPSVRTTDFQLNDDQLPLLIRPWRSSDRIVLKSGGHQKIKRIFIDQKIAVVDRRLAMVLVDQKGTVLSLLGYKDSVFPKRFEDGHSYRLLVRT